MALKRNLQVGQVFGHIFQDADWSPRMVVIPAGAFEIGADEHEVGSKPCERPRHKVVIEHAFALGEVPVTARQYEHFLASSGYESSNAEYWSAPTVLERWDYPAALVSWHDAQAYLNWLSEQLAAIYRLPTEAQWEYACRAGTQTPFSTGQTISHDQANFDLQLHAKDIPILGGTRIGPVNVGSYAANPFGLKDMHGNIWEWVEDCWHPNYEGAPLVGDQAWESSDKDFRVLRGGHWGNSPEHLRSAARDNDFSKHSLYKTVGFRVLRVL